MEELPPEGGEGDPNSGTDRQERFRHLQAPGNEAIAEELQAQVDERWERLLHRCSN